MLDQVGCSFKSEGGILKVVKGSLQIMKGIRKNGLYRLQGKTITNSAGLVSISNLSSTKLWHHRLGPISERGLEELHKQGLTGNLEKLEFCEHCLFGKQKKVKFSHATHTTRAIIDYVHSDAWGPTRTSGKMGIK